MTELPPSSAPSSMRRDVISAYAASAAKILSWVVVLGLVYRRNEFEFAVLALIRGTLGILNYTTLGLSPAMIRMLAQAKSSIGRSRDDAILNYYTPSPAEQQIRSLYANGLVIAMACAALGFIANIAYASFFDRIYTAPYDVNAPWVVFWIGAGTILRLASDAPGSLLQAQGLIARDNIRVALAEIGWVAICLANGLDLDLVALAYAFSGGLLLAARAELSRRLTGLWLPRWQLVNEQVIKQLLSFGLLVLFAQLADYLYAPCDYILIRLLIGWGAVATYTPAMTIDSGMLLLVGGLSSVILPRTALAHAAGEMERVRRYYIYGTLGSAFLLIVAAIVVWIASPLIFRVWLGNDMRPTQVILPLVLIHTVVGGSSAVGRSILLGMGKVSPFTISVLLAGVGNVVLSYIFVRHLHLGLKGIVYGTIVVVVLRCGVWMPWYVLRATK